MVWFYVSIACVAAADGIASRVLGPELKTALHESWSYVMNEIHRIATHLQIVTEQPQPDSEYSCVIFKSDFCYQNGPNLTL